MATRPMATRPFQPNFREHAYNTGSVAVVGAVANRFTQINLKGGLIFGACGELSSLVSRFAIRYITNNQLAQKATSLTARVFGGHYLGNLALSALGFAPIAFGPATVAVQLFAPTAIAAALKIIQALGRALFGAQASQRV